jgi:hypothetical protein
MPASAKPRGGRPPATGTTRSVAVLVRLTPKERTQLKAASARAGQELGPWMRELALRAGRP